MSAADHPDFTIVGSGLAGALLACYLARAGRRVDLYEKRPDPRGTAHGRERSINLALSVRGLHALGDVGLAEEVRARAIPMRGRMMHDRAGRLTFQPYGKDESEAIHSVSRSDLNVTLINAAARHLTVRLFFRQKCTVVDLDTSTVELLDEAARTTSRVACRTVVGADGAYSAVRAQLQKREGFNYSQDYLTHGYKELTMPAGPGGSFPLEKHALHIWPRRSFMMIALPNRDGSFTCTLFWPFEGPNSFAALATEADVRRFFLDQFPDVVPLMPALTDDFFKHPTGSLVTVRCSPWSVRDRVVLLGDAAHAVVPFLGQGMNAAFEDCTVLAECLARQGDDRAAAFREFEARRKENTDVLADLCVRNYVEMRDLVGSRAFLWRKKLDLLLSKLLPGWYVPLYTLVSFTRTPYAVALRRAERQERVARLAGLGIALLLALVLLLWLRLPSPAG